MTAEEAAAIRGPAADLVAYQAGAVVSRTLVKKSAGTATVFAFDAGQELSEHTAPYDALVVVLDGQARFRIGSQRHDVCAGGVLLLPAGEPHAVVATERFKMLLVMIRSQD
jgi:quercetin dioxygenase-like cupin family protein